VYGGILSTLVVAALVFAVSEGSILGWAHPLVVGALIVTIVAAIAFAHVERVHPQPLIDLSLLRRSNLMTAGGLNLLIGLWSAGELVVLSLYLQQTLHDSPLVAGLVIAPQGAVGFITGMFGARLVRSLGMRRLLMSATGAAGLGFLFLMLLPTTGHYNPMLAAVMFVGFGTVGTAFGSTVFAASGMAAADQGLVGGVVNTTRQIGAAIGVALLVAIADGADAHSGVATIAGDRRAMLVAAAIALVGTVVAWIGTKHSGPSGLPVVDAVPPATVPQPTPAFSRISDIARTIRRAA
jgi:predicted MFS family arabinose efflux permease